jgi:hypothetical protein
MLVAGEKYRCRLGNASYVPTLSRTVNRYRTCTYNAVPSIPSFCASCTTSVQPPINVNIDSSWLYTLAEAKAVEQLRVDM